MFTFNRDVIYNRLNELSERINEECAKEEYDEEKVQELFRARLLESMKLNVRY